MLIEGIRYFLVGLLLIVIQFFLIQQVNFGTWVLPMPYVYLILILPFQMNRFAVLIIAYLTGFLLDGISDSNGLHAAACTTLAFARHFADKLLLDTDSIQLQGMNYLTPSYKGFRYYFIYTSLLVLIHHLVFFSLNYFKFTAFFTIIWVSLLSTLATFVFILLYFAIAGRR